MAEGSFSAALHPCFQKLFTWCGLQNKRVFGQFILILLQQMGYPKLGIH